MLTSYFCPPTWRHRPHRLQLAVLALGMLGATQSLALPVVYSARVVATHSLNGIVTSVTDERSGSDGVSASATGGTASALSGTLSAGAQGSGSFTAGPISPSSRAQSDGAASRARLTWLGAALDPVQAGTLGTFSFSITGSVQAQATPAAVGSGTASANISASGVRLSTFGRMTFCPECGTGIIRPFQPLSGSFAIKAGRGLEVEVLADAIGGQAGQFTSTSPAGNGSGSGSVNMTYSLQVFEDRRHWEPAGGADMTAAESWIERAGPDAESWATFNSVDSRTLALTLPGDREWRGLIVDGEALSLQMGGNTLTLGNAGPSQKTFSIRVGEGRDAGSALTLRNGTVLASNDVLVGGPFGSTGPIALLTLDNGAVLDQSGGVGLGSVSVGDQGPGALVVRGGSRLTTNVLALARNAPTGDDAGPLRSTLDIDGPGSKVTATLVSLADRGDATATVSAGGVLQTQSMDLAQRPGSTATLTIDGVGSKLVMTGGFVDIGAAGGRATLQALRGGAIEGNNTVFRVGSGKPSDFSVMRVSGAGSELSGAAVVVNAGGSLEVRDGARWSGPGNLLEVKGGQATFDNARVKLGDVVVEGLLQGDSLVSTGRWDINNGAVVDATGANLSIDSGGRLTLNGSGSRLFGFNELNVNGLLTVNSGSVLEGDTLGLQRESSLQGTGTVKVNKKFTAEGMIKPGNSPGLLRIEGNVELASTAVLELEVGGAAAGTEYDVFEVTGSLTLLGGQVNLSFINGFAPRAGQQFVLLDVGGTFQSTAAFGVTGLESGWQFNTAFDSATGKLTLNSLSDGVSAVPEPGSWGLMALGLLAVAARRRRSTART